MILEDRINNDYFDWMYELMCGHRFAKEISFRKLLMHLHRTEFVYILRRDKSRAADGVALRYRFPYEASGIDDVSRYLDGPCSVLEMMVALAIRCEETIMDNPLIGDRTSQWFWTMLTSLGLHTQEDSQYDREYVDTILETFLNREYEPNGKGGLFTVRGCEDDLRNVEIWYQMCWYLDTIG